jgi:hypothetical protein
MKTKKGEMNNVVVLLLFLVGATILFLVVREVMKVV